MNNPTIKNPKIDKIIKIKCGTKLLSVIEETLILWLSFGVAAKIIMMITGIKSPIRE